MRSSVGFGPVSNYNQAETTGVTATVVFGPSLVRGRTGGEGSLLRSGRSTDKATVSPHAIHSDIVHVFDGCYGVDGSVHVCNELEEETPGSRQQAI